MELSDILNAITSNDGTGGRLLKVTTDPSDGSDILTNSDPLGGRRVKVDLVGGGGGSGTVTSVSVANANGFSGIVSNPTTSANITLQTSVTGLIKGDGTSLLQAVSGVDYLSPTLVAAKGDILVATANDTVSILPVGTNGQFLVADSAEPTGLRYETIAAAQNFANADLTATGNRSHTFATNNLHIQQTTGTFGVFKTDGATSSNISNIDGDITGSVSNATTSSSVIVQGSANVVSLNSQYNDSSFASNLQVSPESINLAFTANSDLKLDGDAGTLNQVLISQGPGVAPIWGNQVSVYYVTNKTANYTLLNTDDAVTIDTTSGSVTLTMPVSPIVGKKFTVFFVAGTNNLVFDGNGSDVQNLPSGAFSATQTYGSATYLNTSFEYVFIGSKWRLI